MSAEGTPKFSTLVVREITAEIGTSTVTLTGKAAYLDRTNGATHGWTKGEGAVWSKETIERLRSLQESMELDLASLHFIDAAPSQIGRRLPSAEPGGIGEHLEDADQA